MRMMLAAVLGFGVANGFVVAQDMLPERLTQSDELSVGVKEAPNDAEDLQKIRTVDQLWELLDGRKLLGLKHVDLVSSIAGIDQAGSVRFLGGVHAGQFEYHFRLRTKDMNLVLRFARSERVREAVLVAYWTEGAEGVPANTTERRGRPK